MNRLLEISTCLQCHYCEGKYGLFPHCSLTHSSLVGSHLDIPLSCPLPNAPELERQPETQDLPHTWCESLEEAPVLGRYPETEEE